MADQQPERPGTGRQPPQGRSRRWLFWLVMLVVAIGLNVAFAVFGGSGGSTIAYSDFVSQVKAGNVTTAAFSDSQLSGSFRKPVSGASQYQTQVPSGGDTALVALLLEHDVKVTASTPVNWLSGAANLLWVLLLVGIGGMFLFQMRGGGGLGAIGRIGQTRARLYSEERPEVTFADVASNVEAKQELQEIIEFLRDPQRFTLLGARIPRGVLLVGPPGTGKTLMARAVAGEARVPFFSVSATEFVEMFVGVGAARIRDLFERAKKVAPCIVFVDEIDSIGRERGSRNAIASNEEREQTLNQLLVEMDGFEPNQGIIVLSATNRPDILDPALLRPGRFDRRVELMLPDREGRLAILKLHAAKVRMSGEAGLESVARRTPGFSGADLANLVNEAALLAARARRSAVAAEDLEGAFEKVLLGARQQFAMTEEERRLVAVHEAGHAIAGFFQPGADPPEKVSVVPHGRSLGATQFAAPEDRRNLPESYVRAKIVVGLAGRAAERLVLGEVSSGAENDLAMAMLFARSMVMRWGMGPELGPVTIPEQSPLAPGMVSADLLARADREVVALLQEGDERAQAVLTERRRELDALVDALQEQESLDRTAIERLLKQAAGKAPRTAA